MNNIIQIIEKNENFKIKLKAVAKRNIIGLDKKVP